MHARTYKSITRKICTEEKTHKVYILNIIIIIIIKARRYVIPLNVRWVQELQWEKNRINTPEYMYRVIILSDTAVISKIIYLNEIMEYIWFLYFFIYTFIIILLSIIFNTMVSSSLCIELTNQRNVLLNLAANIIFDK